MYEVRIGERWYSVYEAYEDGSVLALYEGKFRRFPQSAYEEVRDVCDGVCVSEEKEEKKEEVVREKKPGKKEERAAKKVVVRKKSVKKDVQK